MQKPYRPCVVAVIRNQDGQVLAGERADCKGAWQLPQGGIDPGETAETALFRELREEIGTDRVRILQRLPQAITYEFPVSMQRQGLKAFRGQIQDWFLLELIDTAMPDLSLSEGEFQNLSWMEANSLIEGIVVWKREAYIEGLSALLNL